MRAQPQGYRRTREEGGEGGGEDVQKVFNINEEKKSSRRQTTAENPRRRTRTANESRSTDYKTVSIHFTIWRLYVYAQPSFTTDSIVCFKYFSRNLLDWKVP
jgi:hypothetical protein